VPTPARRASDRAPRTVRNNPGQKSPATAAPKNPDRPSKWSWSVAENTTLDHHSGSGVLQQHLFINQSPRVNGADRSITMPSHFNVDANPPARTHLRSSGPITAARSPREIAPSKRTELPTPIPRMCNAPAGIRIAANDQAKHSIVTNRTTPIRTAARVRRFSVDNPPSKHDSTAYPPTTATMEQQRTARTDSSPSVNRAQKTHPAARTGRATSRHQQDQKYWGTSPPPPTTGPVTAQRGHQSQVKQKSNNEGFHSRQK